MLDLLLSLIVYCTSCAVTVQTFVFDKASLRLSATGQSDHRKTRSLLAALIAGLRRIGSIHRHHHYQQSNASLLPTLPQASTRSHPRNQPCPKKPSNPENPSAPSSASRRQTPPPKTASTSSSTPRTNTTTASSPSPTSQNRAPISALY